jgi:hypothetical protein
MMCPKSGDKCLPTDRLELVFPFIGQIIKVQPPVSDIRGRIYNSFPGGIIVQEILLINIHNSSI